MNNGACGEPLSRMAEMARVFSYAVSRWVTLVAFCAVVGAALLMMGCPGALQAPDNMEPDSNDMQPDDGGTNPDGSGDDGGVDETEVFTQITGTEVLREGASSDHPDGGSHRSNEQFTASYSLTRVNIRSCGEVFVGNLIVETFCGDLEGEAHLTYSSTSTDFTPDSTCPTSLSMGEVQWDVDLSGTYTISPLVQPSGEVVFDAVGIDVNAANVSSPEYDLTFTNPGCPEFDSVSPSSYFWAGVGKGAWGFVTVIIVEGSYTERLDNVLGNDLGDEDFYEIEVQARRGRR